MLRRPATAITLTAKDIADYDKRREDQMLAEHNARVAEQGQAPPDLSDVVEERKRAKAQSTRNRILGQDGQAGASRS